MIAFRRAGGVVLALLTAAAPAHAAPPNCPQKVDVRDLMTVTQFTAAGLDKLTKEQLAALNVWLTQYLGTFCSPGSQAQTAAPATSPGASGMTQAGKPGHAQAPESAGGGTAAFGAPPQSHPKTPNQIESRIVGDFHGWTGDTVFRLENGQVWKQAGPGYFETNLKNPKVQIKKLMIGYVLIVDGYSKEVFVRRIQ